MNLFLQRQISHRASTSTCWHYAFSTMLS